MLLNIVTERKTERETALKETTQFENKLKHLSKTESSFNSMTFFVNKVLLALLDKQSEIDSKKDKKEIKKCVFISF